MYDMSLMLSVLGVAGGEYPLLDSGEVGDISQRWSAMSVGVWNWLLERGGRQLLEFGIPVQVDMGCSIKEVLEAVAEVRTSMHC